MTGTVPESGNWSLFTFQIPPSRIDLAAANPDALQLAYNVGVLELVSISLALVGVALIFAGFGAYISIQRSAKAGARDIARVEVPKAVDEHIRKDSFAVIRGVLKDPEALAALSAEMDKLGILDVTDAGDVEGTLLEAHRDRRRRETR